MWFSKLLRRCKGPVTQISHGRCGELRYQEGARYAEAYYEISGVSKYDLLVWLSNIKVWSDGSTIEPDEKSRIELAFKEWAKCRRNKVKWEEP